MLLSNYFLPIIKENPSEAQIASHRLMLRAGMIRQSAAGIYTWLPFGRRVLDAVASIVREEQNRVGAHEVLMSTIQPAELWQESRSCRLYFLVTTMPAQLSLALDWDHPKIALNP